MLVGGFVSAAGGLQNAIIRAAENEFDVAMYFIGSPHSWRLPSLSEKEVVAYQEARTNNPQVEAAYAHALYLANLASPDQETFTKSVAALTTTMLNGEKVGLKGVIFHLGSCKDGQREAGLDRVAQGMKLVLENSPGNTKIIMENSVQQGNKVGTLFSDLRYVLQKLEYHPRVSICLDLCHGFAMGYNYSDAKDYKRWISDIQEFIGIENLECFHVNDSKGELDSRIDRHANVGEGHIGLDGFDRIMNEALFKEKSFILEVPGVLENGPSKADKDILLGTK